MTRAWLIGGGLFVGLSATDFLLTFALIDSGYGHEANPVAAAWLDRHGWVGLAAFKGLAMTAVLGVVGVLARLRPTAAAGVLALGCATLFGVAVYSRGLLHHAAAEAAFFAELDTYGSVEVVPAEPNWAEKLTHLSG